MKDGQPQRSERAAVHAVPRVRRLRQTRGRSADALDARRRSPACSTKTSTIRAASALLTFSEDPDFFLDRVRPLLNGRPFAALVQKPEYTMLGRTYSLGYEPDLPEVLLHRPRRTVLNPDWKWAVWYPLRRSGKFAQLPAEEQRVILAEHGAIGMSFGAGDYAHDIRLACHGLDKDDNDFVVGLIGKDLLPALGDRADDAEDAADVAVPRTARPVLRRPGGLAERELTRRPQSDADSQRSSELGVLSVLCG